MCDRLEYVSIKDRHPYTWPNGSKLAVFLALNVEIFTFDDESNIGLIGDQPAPYVAAWGWKDYGNRQALRKHHHASIVTKKSDACCPTKMPPFPLPAHVHGRVGRVVQSFRLLHHSLARKQTSSVMHQSLCRLRECECCDMLGPGCNSYTQQLRVLSPMPLCQLLTKG